MSTLRILLYMLGAWVGGVFADRLAVAYLADAWSQTTLWSILTVTLAAALFTTLYADARANARPRQQQ